MAHAGAVMGSQVERYDAAQADFNARKGARGT
jgi:hypothetical protein